MYRTCARAAFGFDALTKLRKPAVRWITHSSRMQGVSGEEVADDITGNYYEGGVDGMNSGASE